MTARPARAPRPVMLTVAQAADRLGVDRAEVYHWVRAGLITCVRYPTRNGNPNGGIRITETDVDAFLDDHTQPASAS